MVEPAPVVTDDASAVLPIEVEDWFTWLVAEKGRSANTLSAYRRDLTRYWVWVCGRGGSLDGITAADLDAYVGHLRAEGLAPASIARAMVAVRSLHRFRAEEGFTEADPAASVDTPRVPAGLPKALTETEITALFDAVVGSRRRRPPRPGVARGPLRHGGTDLGGLWPASR